MKICDGTIILNDINEAIAHPAGWAVRHRGSVRWYATERAARIAARSVHGAHVVGQGPVEANQAILWAIDTEEYEEYCSIERERRTYLATGDPDKVYPDDDETLSALDAAIAQMEHDYAECRADVRADAVSRWPAPRVETTVDMTC